MIIGDGVPGPQGSGGPRGSGPGGAAGAREKTAEILSGERNREWNTLRRENRSAKFHLNVYWVMRLTFICGREENGGKTLHNAIRKEIVNGMKKNEQKRQDNMFESQFAWEEKHHSIHLKKQFLRWS